MNEAQILFSSKLLNFNSVHMPKLPFFSNDSSSKFPCRSCIIVSDLQTTKGWCDRTANKTERMNISRATAAAAALLSRREVVFCGVWESRQCGGGQVDLRLSRRASELPPQTLTHTSGGPHLHNVLLPFS